MEHTTVKAPKKHEIWTLRAMIVLGVINMAYFFIWFIQPSHISYLPLYIPIAAVLFFQLLRVLHEWYHYFQIRMPDEPFVPESYRPTVDVLTTYFPGEPYEMIEETLLAIKNIRYPHETWLCDEGDDERLKAFCRKHGIHHVTRDNRKDAKAGNINNALQYAKGEICVILDPDHVPHPDFLDPIIPHFMDPEIGFVQIVQAYKNFDESFVAKGAAQQTFQFYGPMMMSMNTYGTVLAIGANCTFRRKALDSIGGHAPGLAEDMHTAMLLHSKGWKSVYVPRILARGLVPATLHGYFMQQLKWSRGTWDLLIHVLPRIFGKLTWRQRLHYMTVPFYYFSGIIYFLNFLIPILCLVFAILPWKGDFATFLLLAIPLFASTILVRHYVQRWVMEEKERGFHMLGGILQVGTWWVHSLGILYTFIGKKVPYLPTPKDDSGRSPWKLLLPNIIVAVLSVASVIYGLSYDWNPFAFIMAGIATINFFSMLLITYIGLNNKRSMEKEGEWSPMNAFLWSKRQFWHLRHAIYRGLRFGGLTLLLLLTLVTINVRRYDQKVFRNSEEPVKHNGLMYSGAYVPVGDAGRSDPGENVLARNIVSMYQAWPDRPDVDYLAEIYRSGRIPMITWEPWIESDSSGQSVFARINGGELDDFIADQAEYYAALRQPLLMRFAHEMDNPNYPWSMNGALDPEEFRAAWRHVVQLFNKHGATNVSWVYNPWKSDVLDDYFPGGEFVDWIGVTLLDYGPHLDSTSYSFTSLYEPFHLKLDAYPGVPVMLAEFGSLSADRAGWVEDALLSIEEKFPEIRAVVYFQSDIDRNVPFPEDKDVLNWKISEPKAVANTMGNIYQLGKWPVETKLIGHQGAEQQGEVLQVQGFTYNKGYQWFRNVHALTRHEVEKDFRHMKELGVTTIKRQGPGVYDPNVLTIANEQGMKIHYAIWIGVDSLSWAEQEKEMVDLVADLRRNEEIVSWNLTGTPFNELELLYDPVQRLYEEERMANKLGSLVSQIKELDPARPVSLDYRIDSVNIYRFMELAHLIPQVDHWVLYPSDSAALDQLSELLVQNGISHYWEGTNPEILCAASGFIPWQDRMQNDLVAFDGILDISGYRKTRYNDLLNCQSGETGIQVPEWDFILPAIPTWPGMSIPVHVIRMNGDTPEFIGIPAPWNIEWYLVQKNKFGTPRNMMKVGEGRRLRLKVPEEPENFDLRMVIHNGTYSRHVTHALVLPVHPSQEMRYTAGID